MNGKTIYHVCFGDDEHYYFGSIAAIFDRFTVKQIGIKANSLWNYGITPNHPYKNKLCTIYRGEIHRKKGNRATKLK